MVARSERDPDMTCSASRSQASRHPRSQFISALLNLSDPCSSPRFNAASSTPSHEKMSHWIDMNNWNESAWSAPSPGWFMIYMQILCAATWLVITFFFSYLLSRTWIDLQICHWSRHWNCLTCAPCRAASRLFDDNSGVISSGTTKDYKVAGESDLFKEQLENTLRFIIDVEGETERVFSEK